VAAPAYLVLEEANMSVPALAHAWVVQEEATVRARLVRLGCRILGHAVDNRVFRESSERVCRCGCAILPRDGTETHVRHTLSCFFGGHRYRRLAVRDGHHEYLCEQCGHPLLFEQDRDPYAGSDSFEKKVRYLCGLFGHRVHRVGERHRLTEYACFCGHSFLRSQVSMTLVRHPPSCVASGHAVAFLERRGGHDEFLCRRCGHTFGFAEPKVAS
jgi:hypothetical protein